MNDLFDILILRHNSDGITAAVKVDPDHPVYEGHFPDLPLTPGACQAGLIRQILETALGIPLRLTGSKSLKFTAMHDPGIGRELTAQITLGQEGELLKADASLLTGTETILKLRGTYVELGK